MPSIGIEWVDEYHGIARKLNHNQENARGFSVTLDARSISEHGDDACVDSNFELPTGGLAGSAAPADAVDLVYFSGHGIPDGPIFGVAGEGDFCATADRMRLGTQSCKWVVFDACYVLNHDLPQIWYERLRTSFAGLHYMFGFDAIASDSGQRGRLFAQKLNDGETIREAWIRACIETEDSDKCYAYVRARIDPADDSLDDHWFNRGPISRSGPAPVDFFYLRSNC